MKSTKFLFLMLLGFCAFLYSCNKTNENNKNYDFTATFDTNHEAWYFYKAGSYWIYKNDSTNNNDSLIIDTARMYMLYGQYPTEYMYMHFKSNIFNIDYELMGARAQCEYGVELYFNDSTNYYTFPGFECQGGTIGKIFYFYNENHAKIGSRKILDIIPSFIIGLKTYSNVVEIEIQDYQWEKTIVYWISKNAGILKQQYNDGQGFSSWTVEKMNIIQ